MKINTNLQSLIVQQNLTRSSNALSQTLERLSSGYKINHSSDNAANYSIASNYSAKLSSLSMASDNTAMGMDMVGTAQESISLMQEKGERLHALITQARNGTYGSTSLLAMQQEANAIVNEINRLYKTAEYNGVKLLEQPVVADWEEEVRENAGKKAENAPGKFLAEITKVTPDVIVESPDDLADAIENNTIIGIKDANTLQLLATIVNDGNDCSGKTIILTEDIDLSSINNWTAIGTSDNKFNGTFDGQGHVIKNLNINNTNSYQGLFGNIANSDIKNVGIENANVIAASTSGILVGSSSKEKITNCYVTGNITSLRGTYQGGLVGSMSSSSVSDCFVECDVAGRYHVGGIAGIMSASSISNSYSKSNVSSNYGAVGGLVGWLSGSSLTNSYAEGNVTGESSAGGLASQAFNVTAKNCYSNCNVNGKTGASGIFNSIRCDKTVNIENIISYSTVNSDTTKGNFVKYIANTKDGENFYNVNLKNCAAKGEKDEFIGMVCKWEGTAGNYTTTVIEYDTSEWLSNIASVKDGKMNLQVGIYGNNNSSITFDTVLKYDLKNLILTSDDAYDMVNTFLNTLSEKATALGAVTNKLESAMESIHVDIENLTSARSTIKDADIAKVSSEYIRQQILQQASSTLLATANQTPALALQLLGGIRQ